MSVVTKNIYKGKYFGIQTFYHRHFLTKKRGGREEEKKDQTKKGKEKELEEVEEEKEEEGGGQIEKGGGEQGLGKRKGAEGRVDEGLFQLHTVMTFVI